MNKPLSISVGIAAYNADKNIGNMLRSLIRQKGNRYSLLEIVVHSDASNDNTVKVVKSIRNKKIKIIDNRQRKGFAGSVKKLLEVVRGDVIILLNDDIKIIDNLLIEKLIKPFIDDKKVGLICGNPLPLPPINFIDNAITSSVKAYIKMRYTFRDGNNKYSIDGKILALSNLFIKKLHFPKNISAMGTVDLYLYFSCISHGFTYLHIKNAVVYYRNPTTFKDYVNWTSRNNANIYELKKRFGQLVDEEYKKPTLLLLWFCMGEFIRNPLGCLFIFLTNFYIQFKAKKMGKNFNPTWEVITTSKNLSKI